VLDAVSLPEATAWHIRSAEPPPVSKLAPTDKVMGNAVRVSEADSHVARIGDDADGICTIPTNIVEFDWATNKHDTCRAACRHLSRVIDIGSGGKESDSTAGVVTEGECKKIRNDTEATVDVGDCEELAVALGDPC